MTRQHVHLVIAGVVIVITIVGSIVASVLFPPAAAAVAAIGAAIVAWFVNKALDKVADSMSPEAPQATTPEPAHQSLQQRTRTIHRHYSERDVDGYHRSADIEESITEDEPPERPKKPTLTR